MPIRQTAWTNLKQAKEWACVISAPAGRVCFVCPECRARIRILKMGAFMCPQCQMSYVAGTGALTPVLDRFVIRRALPSESELIPKSV